MLQITECEHIDNFDVYLYVLYSCQYLQMTDRHSSSKTDLTQELMCFNQNIINPSIQIISYHVYWCLSQQLIYSMSTPYLYTQADFAFLTSFFIYSPLSCSFCDKSPHCSKLCFFFFLNRASKNTVSLEAWGIPYFTDTCSSLTPLYYTHTPGGPRQKVGRKERDGLCGVVIRVVVSVRVVWLYVYPRQRQEERNTEN